MICSLNEGPTCYQLKPYKKFVQKKCDPLGWKQSNNDCWIDSSLYAMFAPTTSCRYFSDKLDQLNESDDENEKNIALYISNYLQGIDLIKWSTMKERTIENCKQRCKNEIVKHLLLWNRSHNFPLGIGDDTLVDNPNNEGDPEVDNPDNEQIPLQNMQFDKSRGNNIGNGPQHVLLKFFAELKKEEIHYFEPDAMSINLNCNGQPKPLNNIIDQQFALDRLYKNMLIVSLNGINRAICQDLSTLNDLKTKTQRAGINYTLESIIYGQGYHITSITVCNNQFFKYDNQPNPTRTPLTNIDTILTNADQLIFVYVKNISGGKTTKQKNNIIYSMKQTRRSWNKSKNRKMKKSKKQLIKKMKGGTIGYVITGNLGSLNARGITGTADLAVLRYLGVDYRSDHNVDRIDLLSFYRYPNRRTEGFTSTFLQAIERFGPQELFELTNLLEAAYQARIADGVFHQGQNRRPDAGHAHMAAVTRWLINRVNDHISSPDGRPTNIERDGVELINTYQQEFTNQFELHHAPPVPRMGVNGVGR